MPIISESQYISRYGGPEHAITDRAGNVRSGTTVDVYGSEADAEAQSGLLTSVTTGDDGTWPVDLAQTEVWVRIGKTVARVGGLARATDLQAKADRSEVTAGLAAKADQAAVDGALAAKADASTVAAQATQLDGLDADKLSKADANSTYAGSGVGIDIRTFGAVADEATATVSIASGSNVLTRSSGSWSPQDVGKVLSVPGAQASPDTLGRNNMPAKITGFTNSSTVTLDRTAAATVTNATVTYATDNTATWQTKIDADAAAGLAPTYVVPAVGKPFYVNMLLLKSRMRVVGPGEVKQAPRNWNDAGTSTSNGGTLMPWDGGRGTTTPTQDVQIVGLHINGNKGAHYGSIANRTNGEGINFKYGHNCLALANTIWDTNGDGIDFDECENSRAIGNHISEASTCGIHSSNDNIGNVIAFNTVIHCGWDLYADSGVSVGGIDGAGVNGNKEISFIGNVVDGCRINYAIGDPNTLTTDRFVAIGNRSRSAAATPGLPDIMNAYIGDVPGAAVTVGSAITVAGTATFNGSVLVNSAVQTFPTSSTATALSAKVSTDAVNRYSFRANGSMFWGDGTNAQDTNLARTTADRLDMGAGDSFKIDGTWNGGRLLLGTTRVWVGADALVRAKTGSDPTSDTDGNVVGGNVLTGTTANFVLATNSRNTTGKYAGRAAWNTSTSRPIWAVGPLATDNWVYADGTVAHTPA